MKVAGPEKKIPPFFANVWKFKDLKGNLKGG